MTKTFRPLFELGRIVITHGASKATGGGWRTIFDLMHHVTGNWGAVDPEDQATNDEAVRQGGRILSAYPIDPEKPCKGWGENTIWIITEADRSVTTILLPDEY